ncbi:capsule biosynthesis protein [Paracoccus sp. p4-l81]
MRLFRLKRSDSVLSAQRAENAADDDRPVVPPEVAAPASPAPGPAASPPAAGPAATSGGEQPFSPAPDDDGFASVRLPGSAAQDAVDAKTAEAAAKAEAEAARDRMSPEELQAALIAVRAEGLTSRQLRTAARLAVQHNITAPTSEEAVVLLRRRGIDPFHRGSLNDLISEEARRSRAATEGPLAAAAAGGGAGGAGGPPGVALARIQPQKMPTRGPNTALGPAGRAMPPPAPEPLNDAQRAREILRIQRDIARRRRRRAFFMFLRLAAFVLLPTFLAGYYYYVMATPLYETKSEFIIQKADGTSGVGSKLGGLMASAGIAGSTDSITVQSYLTSRDALIRLEQDVGFRKYLSGDTIDPLTRIPADATNEATFRAYTRMVKIGFDPSEGLIRMAVRAPDPNLSRDQSLALIRYAEEQVDHLTTRLREDQMAGAQQSYKDAEAEVEKARLNVLDLQSRMGVLDATAESSIVMSRIGGLETQLQKKRLELTQLLSNPQPNAARVAGVRGDISRLEQELTSERSLLTEATQGKDSLAAMSGELRLAEGALLARQEMLAAAAAQVEAARTEANKQTRYLSLGVNPVAPDEPTWPRAFENTLVAFLIFSGIYLMISLTASILREQLSA